MTAYDAYGNVATGYTGTVAFDQRRSERPAADPICSSPPTRGR